MPTAPTRTKLCPVVPGVTPTSFTVRALFGDVLTLPVRLRPPEMGIVVGIWVMWLDWEGDFVLGGWKCESIFRISGREVKTAPHFRLVARPPVGGNFPLRLVPSNRPLGKLMEER